MFAVIAPALVSGAVLDRMAFRASMLFIVLWCGVIYAPLAHWVQGPGRWMDEAALSAVDFAGGTVVHISTGVAAVVAAIATRGRPLVERERSIVVFERIMETRQIVHQRQRALMLSPAHLCLEIQRGLQKRLSRPAAALSSDFAS